MARGGIQNGERRYSLTEKNHARRKKLRDAAATIHTGLQALSLSAVSCSEDKGVAILEIVFE
ncbi:MAG: hypothetical protein QF542_00785, partial [Alphaproteobacteria bacterium]|nr:hypothetical protein [Alphaproteobacteria bacterium]